MYYVGRLCIGLALTLLLSFIRRTSGD